MGNRSTSLINDTEKSLEEMTRNPVTAAIVRPIDQAQIAKDATDEIVRLALDEKLGVEELFKIQMSVTNRIHAELLEKKNSLEFQLAARILDRSKGEAEDALALIKSVAAKVGVQKSLIHDANTDTPSLYKKLLRKTTAALSSMISAVRSQITFKSIIGLYPVYRFGFSPLLIYQTYVNSGLGLIGLASGMTCIGLSGRFLYIHPDILSFLKTFSNFSTFSPENIDFFVLFMALKGALEGEIGRLAKQGLLDSLKKDYQLFAPFLGKAAGWIGWSAYILDTVIRSENYVDVFNCFVEYLKEKTYLFTIINRVTTAYTTVKDTVTEAAETASKTVSRGAGKAYQFVVDTSYRRERLQEAYGVAKNLSKESVAESIVESIQFLGSKALSYFTSTRNEAIIEMKETVKEELDRPQNILQESEGFIEREPGMVPMTFLPLQGVDAQRLPM